LTQTARTSTDCIPWCETIINQQAKLKGLEAKDWAFEGADASFELLVRRELGLPKQIVFPRIVREQQFTHPPFVPVTVFPPLDSFFPAW
jgi:hypothetical protein